MNTLLKQLILYQFEEDAPIWKIAASCDTFDESVCYQAVHEILDLATTYGWTHNLWQCYLSYHLCTCENSYTLSKERRKEPLQGSIQTLLKHDMTILQALFHYDFHDLDEHCGFPCFSLLCDYQAIEKRNVMMDQAMGQQILACANALAKATNAEEMLSCLDGFYEQYGVGKFAFHKAFRIQEDHGTSIVPIRSMDTITLDELIGYESQKEELLANTESFLAGKRANNVLLYGDSGTGKSTSIKAIANMFYERGLRLIEVHKHQFHALQDIIQQIKTRNYCFIIYMDDLSFEEDETEYKYLKAVIEGGLEVRPDNILIYATSNRRHLVKETWRDRNDVIEEQDLHLSETMAEKLSLAARFGISIYYGKPSAKEYQSIVSELAKREELSSYSEAELWQMANAWELRHGGMSGRCARQMIDYLCAQAPCEDTK